MLSCCVPTLVSSYRALVWTIFLQYFLVVRTLKFLSFFFRKVVHKILQASDLRRMWFQGVEAKRVMCGAPVDVRRCRRNCAPVWQFFLNWQNRWIHLKNVPMQNEYIWIELNWIKWNGIELSWVELNWTELSWIELNWIELSMNHQIGKQSYYRGKMEHSYRRLPCFTSKLSSNYR